MSEDRFAEALSAAVVVRPGETLVLAFDRRLSMDDVDEMAERIKRHLPQGSQVLIADGGGITLGVIKT